MIFLKKLAYRKVLVDLKNGSIRKNISEIAC